MPSGVCRKLLESRDERRCPNCDVLFFARQAWQRFCCQDCRYAWKGRRYRDLRVMLEGMAVAMEAAGVDLKRVAETARGRVGTTPGPGKG